MKADLISLVEAAYRLEDDLESWLRNLVRVADAAISGGRGVFGIIVKSEPGEDGDDFSKRTQVLASGWSGLPDGILEMAAPLLEFTPTGKLLQRYVEAGPVGTLTGVFAKHAGEFSKRLAATGFADALYLRAADAKGVELVLAIPGDAPIRIPATRRLLLSHVASHIKTAYRLRGKSRDFLEDDGDVEAVLSPNGKVEHASGPATERDARSVLRTAALACAKVKSEARAEGDASPLSEWKALFNGRWSVVDHFDNDGKMFILARRNEPDVPQARGLTPRESLVAGLASQGYSNKEIHYEIGLPMSTIASSLTSAILKLGLSSRTELVRVLSAGRRV